MKQSKDSQFFSSIGTIVNDISANLGIDRGLKIVSLSKMWPKIVGPRFEKTSKIFSVHENNGFDIIVVAVSSSSVSQELIFHKNEVIKKIYKTCKELEFKIKDIQFSTKYWKEDHED
ncbi:MAG: hypothetical protein A2Y25_07660 [Candidatus Melainabacteria bacterium GWF2_37_15]|nr:MAG: hypothetical protein A2Y25_07660 [Candidatus Melainabacteria bacterium GWF2_37_15]